MIPRSAQPIEPSVTKCSRFVGGLCLLAFTLALASTSGCASVDFDLPKTASYAYDDTSETSLARRLSHLSGKKPGESGFYLLIDGINALAARLAMAKLAERSIDAQYYLISNDPIGNIFIASLLKAADRGVRVRLLLDDIQTQGYDAGMAALDSHPNFEIRIFNPFAGRDSRTRDITAFQRVNRRMHNKSFTVDNQISLIGGRNIADEYFAADKEVSFGDLDVVGVGPVVQDVSTMFDSYWNHISAAPVPAFAKMPDDPAAELERLRGRLDAAVAEIQDSPYAAAVVGDAEEFFAADGSGFTWAGYRLVYDDPDKSLHREAKNASSIVTPLRAALLAADTEIIILSPYFVPLRSGIEAFGRVAEQGVEVEIITNSLAANNHAVVHSGYAPSRKPLLKRGVKLYEVRANAAVSSAKRGGAGAPLATLHTKAFVVDRKTAFIGSFNFDPRSVDINTELGVLIESPEIASFMAEAVDKAKDTRSYEVILDDRGRLRWADRSGETEVLLTHEPQTTWWRRFSASFMRVLPIRGQL